FPLLQYLFHVVTAFGESEIGVKLRLQSVHQVGDILQTDAPFLNLMQGRPVDPLFRFNHLFFVLERFFVHEANPLPVVTEDIVAVVRRNMNGGGGERPLKSSPRKPIRLTRPAGHASLKTENSRGEKGAAAGEDGMPLRPPGLFY